jgi:hypothetical protein
MKKNRARFAVALVCLPLIAGCVKPEAFSAAMDPVQLVDGSRQQTAVGQVNNGCLEGKVTQLVTYHQKRGSHALKPVASGTVATKGGCTHVLAAVAGIAAARVGGRDVIAHANSLSVSQAAANVNKNSK